MAIMDFCCLCSSLAAIECLWKDMIAAYVDITEINK